MAGLNYDEEASRRLEAVYLGRDIVAQRAYTLDRLGVSSGEAVLDIGSGPGFLCAQIGALVGPAGRVRGVDISPVMIHRASARNPESWIDFVESDATALPDGDACFDVVVSTQVAEYVPNIDRFCEEAFRVLKPGGRALFLATDWETISWHSEEPARMRRVLAAFAPHCAHSSLPRSFSGHLRKAGFLIDDVSVFPILNTDWNEGNYSHGLSSFIANYVRGQKTVPDEELSAWADEQRVLGEKCDYFFLSNRVFFSARKA